VELRLVNGGTKRCVERLELGGFGACREIWKVELDFSAM